MAGYYALDVAAEITKQRSGSAKQPFPHQREAFAALSKTLPIPIKGYRGTLLVLPTGGGKTFTAANWVCRNVLSQGIKVLWLAQSSYLIDQAAGTFNAEIHNAAGRGIVNLRVVSSSSNHSNSGSISPADDVLICTTQTAISAYSSAQTDGAGNPAATPFRKFVDSCRDSELFVVVDEAHHTPAYGCRNLLISLRESNPNLYVLGLTATPMHMDSRISGWLKNIYDKWICYEADKNVLQANKVLAVPKYIERDTGEEFEVDDALFDRLMKKHKDLPENIIEHLAENHARNDFIVSDYLNNREDYGKTLIFADRWFQCEYLTEKLKEQGVKAGAVYSVVSGQEAVHRGGAGRRGNAKNEKIMRDFRDGNLDVVVNVKMLTEGVDVPDVKTVLIPRQTTSSILLTQMIGRALRGEKAGGGSGKKDANIVFFTDSWRRALPWADARDGGLDAERPIAQGRNPMELVSVQLIRRATADIKFDGVGDVPYLTFVPIGFYACEYTVAVSEETEEELVSFAEKVVVYESGRDKYEALLDHLVQQDLSEYAAENANEDDLTGAAAGLAARYFDAERDGFDGQLHEHIARLIRHVAQNGTKPEFLDFHERDRYDLDALAESLLDTPPSASDTVLTNAFNDGGLLWECLYKTYDNFMDAYHQAQKRVLAARRGAPAPAVIAPSDEGDVDLTDEQKRQVFARDNHTCLCCGRQKGRGVVLNADHIMPVSMGGKNVISNLQTLCKYCNAEKGTNAIDYRINRTPLRRPKKELNLFDGSPAEDWENTLSRIVNEFYHCKAMRGLNRSLRRSGKYYHTWEILLFEGNDPQWLAAHGEELLGYIRDSDGGEHVRSVLVKSGDGSEAALHFSGAAEEEQEEQEMNVQPEQARYRVVAGFPWAANVENSEWVVDVMHSVHKEDSRV